MPSIYFQKEKEMKGDILFITLTIDNGDGDTYKEIYKVGKEKDEEKD